MRTEEVVAALRSAGCVFAEDEAAVLLASAANDEELALMLGRRVAGEPLEQVVGWVDFAGLRLRVAPGVFVPRQRTRFLADLAADALSEAAARRAATGPATGSAAAGSAAGSAAAGDGAAGATAVSAADCVFVEPFCGAAPLGAVVRRRCKEVRIWVSDVDPAALGCARENVPGTHAVEGSVLAGLPDDLRGGVDVIAAVPPYVPVGQLDLMPREAREHEPRGALVAGADGLDLVRELVEQAEVWLRLGGRLLMEMGTDQAETLRADVRGGRWRAALHVADRTTVVDLALTPSRVDGG